MNCAPPYARVGKVCDGTGTADTASAALKTGTCQGCVLCRVVCGVVCVCVVSVVCIKGGAWSLVLG